MGKYLLALRYMVYGTCERYVLALNIILKSILSLFVDRYVIVGNHRDSLTYGGVEPGTGTAVLMELARVLGDLYKNKGM